MIRPKNLPKKSNPATPKKKVRSRNDERSLKAMRDFRAKK